MKRSSSQNTPSALVLLLRLIDANDWVKINNIFLTDHKGQQSFKYLAGLIAKSSSFNGMSILHACVRFDPPSLLLARMIELCPNGTRARDCLDRTPLHVAAGTGASKNVIKVLVNANPDACMVQDKDGRTPLHLACDSSCELFEVETRGALYGHPTPSHDSIRILLEASLDSAILEDIDGMSAIEYALISNANLQTVRLIQQATQLKMVQLHKEEKANKTKKNSPHQRDNTSSAKNHSYKTTRPRLSAPSA